MKLKIDSKQVSCKYANSWRLNNSLASDGSKKKSERNKNMSINNWKWKYNTINSLGHTKSSHKKETYSFSAPTLSNKSIVLVSFYYWDETPWPSNLGWKGFISAHSSTSYSITKEIWDRNMKVGPDAEATDECFSLACSSRFSTWYFKPSIPTYP